MKRFFEILIQGIIGAAFVVFFAYLMLEWAVGCGETYTDSRGIKHANECVLTATIPTIGK
jgi:hypothetical protein